MTLDSKRQGTTTLFSAMNSACGKVISLGQQRHQHQEWIKFQRRIDDATPQGKELYIIAGNDSAHKHLSVGRWLKRHPRFQVHYTLKDSSWLNVVGRFFRDLKENRLRRGVFRSVPELIDSLDDCVDRHNEKPKPFIWTAKAIDILAKVIRAKAAAIDHHSV